MTYVISKFYDRDAGIYYDYYKTDLKGYIDNCRNYWGWKYLKDLRFTRGSAQRTCNRLNKRLIKK